MAKKPPPPTHSFPRLVAGWFFQPGVRWATLSLCAIGLMLAGWAAIWRQVRPRVLESHAYRVELEDVVLTPAPPWIQRDVRREALERGGLEFPLDLLDPGVLPRVATAVEANPWIAKVVEVRKRHPSRIDVTVEYRRPAAMVEVRGGLYPVDELGILLPSDDFTPESAARYPRVGGFETAPLGPPGSGWGDPRVLAAARLGTALADYWAGWRLARITLLQAGTPDASSMEFQISTAGGSVIVWGHAPGAESPSEPPLEAKIARVQALAERPHGIDGDAAALIDLRRASSGQEPARTARRAGKIDPS